MENNLKLSVIVPIYGVESYIEKCLKSIMAQSYKNLEIICVNDATKDSSMKIVESLAEEDDRIKIVNNPQNMGLFRARVEGMKVASGAYLAFVDADDYVSCDWFRLLVLLLFVFAGSILVGIMESIMARFRFKKLPQLLCGGFVCALLGVILLFLKK